MNRIKDYTGFAVRFAGLGYIVLWPLSSPDFSGKPFGASIFCHDGSPSPLDFLCNSAHPLMLPPALHVIGFLSAVFVTLQLLLHVMKRSRRAARSGETAAPALAARMPDAPPPPPRQKPQPPLRPVKPRTHFGLRGMPR
jgi:hypothetical protein